MSSSRETDLSADVQRLENLPCSAAPFLLFVVHHEGESHLSTIPTFLEPTSDRRTGKQKAKAQE